MNKKRMLTAVLTLCIMLLLPMQSSAATVQGEWIDRIVDLPQYASDFYGWLEDNATAEGALVDVTKGQLLSGDNSYVYVVDSFAFSQDFTFPEGADAAAIQQAAVDAAMPIASAKFAEEKAYIFTAFHAFDQDHPEVFWLNGTSKLSSGMSMSISYAGTNGTVNGVVDIMFILKQDGFDIRGEQYQDVEELKAQIATRDGYIDTILSECTGATRYETLQNINAWLTKHNCYNNSADLNAVDSTCRECIGALQGNTQALGPVCEGYAKAFKVLCDRLGIPCMLVEGIANNGSQSEAHMWNYVQMEDGSWYAIDVTWNDPVMDGVTTAVSGYEGERYFLIGQNTVNQTLSFSQSHTPDLTMNNSGVSMTEALSLAEKAYVMATPEPEQKLNGVHLAEDGCYYYYTEGEVDTSVNSLVDCSDTLGKIAYFENGKFIADKYGLVEFAGGRFLVVNGLLLDDCHGAQLVSDGGNNGAGTFYFMAYGMVQSDYTGLAIYDGQTFYVENGVVRIDFNGVYEYNGAKFVMAAGRIIKEHSGLCEAADGVWYYLANGQIQTQYSGIASYTTSEGTSYFYIVEGVFQRNYTGELTVNGVTYQVINGEVLSFQ